MIIFHVSSYLMWSDKLLKKLFYFPAWRHLVAKLKDLN